MPYNKVSLWYTAGLIIYEVKIAVDLVCLTFIENSIQGGYRQNPAILIMAKTYSVSAFGGASDSTFRFIRPAFQHEIEQVFPAIEA